MSAAPPITIWQHSTDALDDRGFLGLFFTLTLLALGATAGRFVVRRRQAIGAASPSPTKTSARAPAAAWADGLNGAAALVLVAYVCVWFVPWPVYGDTSPSSFVYTFWLLSWLLLYLVKFSLLLLYRALFAVSATFRAAWWGVAAFTAIVFLGGFVALFWICGRPGAFLDEASYAAPETLGVLTNMVITSTVVNVLSDLACMALPLGMLRTLRVGPAKKVGLACVFALALIVIVFDVMRTVEQTARRGHAVFALLQPPIAVLVCALPVYGSLVASIARRGSAGWRRLRARPRAGRDGPAADLSGERLRPLRGSDPSLGSAASLWSQSTVTEPLQAKCLARPSEERDVSGGELNGGLNYGVYHGAEGKTPHAEV